MIAVTQSINRGVMEKFETIPTIPKLHMIISKAQRFIIGLAFPITDSNVYVGNYPSKAFVRHLTYAERE